MKPVEIVREYVAAVESGDVDQIASLLSDDFILCGLTPTPIARDQFLDVERGILAAFSNWSLNLTDIEEDGGVVRATARITGTHTGDLVIPVPDLPVVRATGRSIALPPETRLYTARGGKLAAIYVIVGKGGGFQGIYSQLGVRLPEPSSIAG